MRILIVDDHPIVREGLKHILAADHDISLIDEAGSGQEALDKISRNDYNVVLLDITMPDMSGLSVLGKLKNQRPDLATLILSMHPEEMYAMPVIKAGASGYMHKESAPVELIRAIEKVSNGGLYISPMLAEKMAIGLQTKIGESLHQCLSCREFEIMNMIFIGKTSKQICNELSLSPKTVSTYRSRMLQKMGMKSNIELVRYCIQNHLFD